MFPQYMCYYAIVMYVFPGRGYIGLTFWLSTNYSCFISMDAVTSDKLLFPAFQQRIFITTATQTLIMEGRTWAKVGMLQGCTNLPA